MEETKFTLTGLVTETKTVQTTVTTQELFRVLRTALIGHLGIPLESCFLSGETPSFHLNEEKQWVYAVQASGRYAQPPIQRTLRAATEQEVVVWEAYLTLRKVLQGPPVIRAKMGKPTFRLD